MTGKQVDNTPWNLGESPPALPTRPAPLDRCVNWPRPAELTLAMICFPSVPCIPSRSALAASAEFMFLARAGDLRKLVRDPDGLVLDSKLRRDVLTCGELAQACYDSVEKEASSFRRCWNIYSSKPEKIQDVRNAWRWTPAGLFKPLCRCRLFGCAEHLGYVRRRWKGSASSGTLCQSVPAPHHSTCRRSSSAMRGSTAWRGRSRISS